MGGESDGWIDKVLKSNNYSNDTFKMMDVVDLKKEELTPGMEREKNEEDIAEEYDEHVWTSHIICIINTYRGNYSYC